MKPSHDLFSGYRSKLSSRDASNYSACMAPGSRTSPGSPECSPTILRRQHTFSDSGLSLPPAATDREPSLVSTPSKDVLALIQSQGGCVAAAGGGAGVLTARMAAEGSSSSQSAGVVAEERIGKGAGLKLENIGEEALGTLGEIDLSAGPVGGFDSPVALTPTAATRGEGCSYASFPAWHLTGSGR